MIRLVLFGVAHSGVKFEFRNLEIEMIFLVLVNMGHLISGQFILFRPIPCFVLSILHLIRFLCQC